MRSGARTAILADICTVEPDTSDVCEGVLLLRRLNAPILEEKRRIQAVRDLAARRVATARAEALAALTEAEALRMRQRRRNAVGCPVAFSRRLQPAYQAPSSAGAPRTDGEPQPALWKRKAARRLVRIRRLVTQAVIARVSAEWSAAFPALPSPPVVPPAVVVDHPELDPAAFDPRSRHALDLGMHHLFRRWLAGLARARHMPKLWAVPSSFRVSSASAVNE